MLENGRHGAEQPLPPETDGLNSRFERLVKNPRHKDPKGSGFTLRGKIPTDTFDFSLLEQFGFVLPPDPVFNHVFGGEGIKYQAQWDPRRTEQYTLTVNDLCFRWGKFGHSTVSSLPTTDRPLAEFMHQKNGASVKWPPQQRDDLRTVVFNGIEDHFLT